MKPLAPRSPIANVRDDDSEARGVGSPNAVMLLASFLLIASLCFVYIHLHGS